MNDSFQFKYAELAAKYADLSKTGVSPTDFYLRLHKDGVSKMNIFLLLRDYYSLGLIESRAIAGEVEESLKETG